MNRKIKLGVFLAAGLLMMGSGWASGAPNDTSDGLIAEGDRQWVAGHTDEARKLFEQAVAASPRSTEALMKLAGIQLAGRQYTEAIDTYQRAISFDSNNARAWMGLGLCYLHTGMKERSRAAFAEAVRIEPARKAQLDKLIENNPK